MCSEGPLSAMDGGNDANTAGLSTGASSKESAKRELNPEFLLAKLWQVYSITDDRRRKGFYYLFSSMVLFAILWIKQSQTFELPILKTQVTLMDALAMAPAFIVVLTVRYLYLCTHTLRSFITYLQQLEEYYSKDLQAIGYTFFKLHQTFRLKDLTDNLNVYLFPIKPYRGHDSSFANWTLYVIVVYLTNVAIFLTVFIPLFSYFYIIGWLLLNYPFFSSTVLGLFGMGVYSLLGILFLLSPVHFYYRARPARMIIIERVHSS